MILYHTTSFGGAEDIKEHGFIKPKNFEAYVSFSEEPFTGDISANDVTLKVEVDPSAVEKVEYTEEWYDLHQGQASYIAGEGWVDQFEMPEDIYDDEGWAEPEDEEAAWREGELQSFLYKDGENEWISKTPGEPVAVQVLEEVAVVAHLNRAKELILAD